MEESGKAAPPGWYPTPEGGSRYWDGGQWLDLPSPEKSGAPRRKSTVRTWLLVLAGAVAVAALIAVGLLLNANHEREERAAAAEAREQAAAEADARAAEERASAEDAARELQEQQDEQERDLRRDAVTGVEESVEEMAGEHISDGIIDGEVLEVSCSPVAGGSVDDLTEQTTVFECFVATEDNGDGTMSGFYYNATMNWTTGSFTYGLGAP